MFFSGCIHRYHNSPNSGFDMSFEFVFFQHWQLCNWLLTFSVFQTLYKDWLHGVILFFWNVPLKVIWSNLNNWFTMWWQCFTSQTLERCWQDPHVLKLVKTIKSGVHLWRSSCWTKHSGLSTKIRHPCSTTLYVICPFRHNLYNSVQYGHYSRDE